MDQGKAFIVGRLTANPKFSDEGTDAQRAVFTIAYNRGKDDNRKSNFLDCIAWGKRADIMRDFSKGSGIFVTGDIEQDNYETKDGQKRNRVQINVSSITATINLRKQNKSGDNDNDEEVLVGTKEEETDIPF